MRPVRAAGRTDQVCGNADELTSMRITILACSDRGADDTFEPVVGQVATALRKGGHRVSILAVQPDIGKLISGLKRRQPELVFNLMDQSPDDVHCDVGVIGLLDLLGLPHTSGGPGEAYIQHDPALANKLLASAGIPAEALGPGDRNGWAAPAPRDGRRFYVGLLGNREPTAFPPVETAGVGSAGCRPTMMGSRTPLSPVIHHCNGHQPAVTRLPEAIRARLQALSLTAYRALRLRDYGRVNLRLSAAGEPAVVAVDANCDLEQGGEFAQAAAGGGLEYTTLVNRIAELAMERQCGEQAEVSDARPGG
jgi:D-alanine-D-alanine ligase